MGRPKKRQRSNLGEDQEGPSNGLDPTNGAPESWIIPGDMMNLSNDNTDIDLGALPGMSPMYRSVEPADGGLSRQTSRQVADIDFSDWEPPDLSNVGFLM